MENSQFNRLSAELRNAIFAMALRADKPLEILPDGQDEKGLVEPALTRTCKQIRKDTLLVFYAENQFHIDLDCQYGLDLVPGVLPVINEKLDLARARLAKLSKPKREIIRTITASIDIRVLFDLFWHDMYPEVVVELERMKKLIDDLKRLGIRCKIRTARTQDYHGSHLYKLYWTETIEMLETHGFEVEVEEIEHQPIDQELLGWETVEEAVTEAEIPNEE